ncbi:Pentatricopeptide repeat-containing protein At5g39710 [Linum grandiflorum]
MHIPSSQLYRRFSSISSPAADFLLAERALLLLKRHPYHLNSISSEFTPEAASQLLLKSQDDQTLVLKFIDWARPHGFFNNNLRCKCLAIHILTRFKLYKTAQSLAQDMAVATAEEDDSGRFVFQCLKDTYFVCNSSSAVIDLVVKSYSSVNLIDKARNIVNLAKASGFMPGVLSYNAILDSIIRSRKPFRLAEEVYREMVAGKVSLNVYSYNILIRGFCRVGNLEMGLKLFDEMEKNGCLPNVVTYNTVIDSYCKLKRIDDAFRLLRSMASKGLEPNLFTFNIVINGLCREGRMKETSEILAEMKQKGYVPDEVTYNTLVNGYCREGNFHQALVLHGEMSNNGLSPNVVTFTSLINSMCQAGNLKRAMEFFDQMRVRGLPPNERTYTTLINGFSQQGCMNEAHQLVDEMKGNGFLPSVVTFNTLINGYCGLGRMQEAMNVFEEMELVGFSPDVVSYSTIISGFCRNQELERAFRVKKEMVEKGIQLDAITYSAFIQGLCEERKLIEACDLFQEMVNMNVPPDQVTYTTLIDAYCKEGELSKALNLHEEMIGKGFLPDVVTYSVLINGLNKEARTKEAKRLLLKLYSDDSIPADVIYDVLTENCSSLEFKSVAALIKGFCIKGLMEEADRVFESMIARNHKPDESVFNIIIHGHCRWGNVQKGYQLYTEMVRFGYVPHTVTIISLVKALFSEGMNDQLNVVIGYVLRSCKLSDAELSKVLVEINNNEGNMDVVFGLLETMAKDGLLPNSGDGVEKEVHLQSDPARKLMLSEFVGTRRGGELKQDGDWCRRRWFIATVKVETGAAGGGGVSLGGFRNHDLGQKHKDNVAQRLATMRKDNIAKDKAEKAAASALEQIEAVRNS